MTAFLSALGAVGMAEVGDRTQLLAFLLAIRFRKPLPIVCGIFVGCLVNHGASVLIGQFLSGLVSSDVLHWALSAAFAALAVWVLFPDRSDPAGASASAKLRDFEIVALTATSYFIAEIGDKTEIAAMAFGARFSSLAPVVLGTTLGSLLADVPVVLGGAWAGYRFAPAWPRYAAAAIFCIQSAFVFLG